MKIYGTPAAAAVAIAAMSFAGCNGGGPASTPPAYSGGAGIGPNPHSAANSPWSPERALAGGMRPAVRGSSHLLPNGKNAALLYIANPATSSVTVYGMPAWNVLGELLGFSSPTTLCVDPAQDVYVTDEGDNRVEEYAHGSVSPIRRLTDHQGQPLTCAVDSKTGNLAIANDFGPSFSTGNVIVYKAAKGTPAVYTAPNFTNYLCVAYDASGNLFLDGFNASGNVLLAELPSGRTAFKAIAMNRTISYPGGLAWDGQYLAVGDQVAHVIYQFKVSGSSATEQGSTMLDGATSVFQFFLTGATAKHPQATAVLGADFGNDAASRWDYPAGGTPVKTIAVSGTPFGIAVSK